MSGPAEIVDGWLRAHWPSLPRSEPSIDAVPGCAVLAWAASGGMALTGASDGAPDASPAPAFAVLEELAAQLAITTGLTGTPVDLDAAGVIAWRAALRGLRRNGQVAAGGMTRLLPSADGWCAISLSRPDDVASVPALTENAGTGDAWRDVAGYVRRTSSVAVVERAQMLGIASAHLPDVTGVPRAPLPFRVTRIADPTPIRLAGATVVDLSALWAGPLCGAVLHRAGAHVIKVESTDRPDGARVGDPDFFAWLHRGQEFRSIDFASSAGREELARLLTGADVVIEASRPRALERLGVSPDQVPHPTGQIWVSITGGGRSRPMQIDFGDDAAVAGGLVGRSEGGPVFCADAIADPLTGAVAAIAVAASAYAGGGELIDVSMVDTARAFAAAGLDCPGEHHVTAEGSSWSACCTTTGASVPVAPPDPGRRPC
ncbi:CoA transferase [Gordonia sp. OPL2]|uniref:CoA transferase n=1 Tax=Gordonia sp. OPL2 TaxID=2486274 RepID=UPI0016553FA9|nr:CoA transferase [Gordonia sp. OPL2]ROZ98268.1 CoA transferase [Gordonia sp. OPL2]